MHYPIGKTVTGNFYDLMSNVMDELRKEGFIALTDKDIKIILKKTSWRYILKSTPPPAIRKMHRTS